MGMMLHFNAPEDYKPEIPAGASCQSCVFATGKYRQITAPSSGESLLLCRRLTGEVGFSVWLKMGEDGHPLRCEQCIKDYPYGATFDLEARKKPMSMVETWTTEIVKQLCLSLRDNEQAEMMVYQLIMAVRAEKT